MGPVKGGTSARAICGEDACMTSRSAAPLCLRRFVCCAPETVYLPSCLTYCSLPTAAILRTVLATVG